MKHATSVFTAVVLVFCISVNKVQSQKPEAQWAEEPLTGFLTKGGVVNLIEGKVTRGIEDIAEQALKPKQQLNNGDEVSVGAGGRAEILLNPGYYLRLSQNTRIVLQDISRENLKVKLVHGSAIIEILEISDHARTFGPSIPLELLSAIYPPITIATPQAEFVIVSGGVYRLDVDAERTSDLKVTKGLAFVAGNRVKGGTQATLRSGSATLAKFDKDSADDFDNWSRERAALLIDSNKVLRHTQWSRQLRNNEFSYFRIEDDERQLRARDRHTVSAIGGLVNFAETGVVFKRGDAEWEALAEGAGLQYGDQVRTGGGGRVEILLYPTCYLHLSSDSEMIYAERKGGGAAVKLLRGSAIVTSISNDKDADAPVTIVAPRTSYEVAEKGVYRLNVTHGERSEMIVYEGHLITEEGGKLKEGKKSASQGQETAIVSIDKKALDSLDIWSRQRTGSLSASADWVRYQISKFRRERVFNNGLWYFDKWFRTYTFVPGIWDFNSPYGGRYSVKFRAER